VDFYRKLGLPNDLKILNGQRARWGTNSLTEVDPNPW